MWVGWTLIGLGQIMTGRYWRHYWRWTKPIHGLLGIFSLILNFASGMLLLYIKGWKVTSESSPHSKWGLAVFVMGVALAMAGGLAYVMRLKMTLPWKTQPLLWV